VQVILLRMTLTRTLKETFDTCIHTSVCGSLTQVVLGRGLPIDISTTKAHSTQQENRLHAVLDNNLRAYPTFQRWSRKTKRKPIVTRVEWATPSSSRPTQLAASSRT